MVEPSFWVKSRLRSKDLQRLLQAFATGWVAEVMLFGSLGVVTTPGTAKCCRITAWLLCL